MIVFTSTEKDARTALERHGIKPHPGLPTGYLSISQIAKYHRCAKQYEYHYIHKMRSSGSGSLHIGSAVHDAIEKIHEAQMAGETPDLQAGMESIASYLEHKALTEPWGEEALSEASKLAEEGQQLLDMWWHSFGAISDPIATEQEIVAVVEGVPVIGYVDLVHRGKDGERIVTDYKTSRRAKSQNWLSESLQLWFYAAALDCDRSQVVSLVRPTRKGGEPKVVIHSAEVTAEKVVHAKNIILETADAISKQVFPRCAPGEWWCTEKWCPAFQQCRGAKKNE